MKEKEITKLGNYSPSGHNAASVVDSNGISPTVMENHGTVTATTICLNSKVDGKQPSLSARVYDCEGVSFAVTASFLPSIAEPRVRQIGNIVDQSTTTFANPQRGRVYDQQGISPALDCFGGGGRQPKILQDMKEENTKLTIPDATKQGYTEVPEGGCFDASYPNSSTRRGRVQEEGKVTPTLCASNEICYYESSQPQFRIRKLTPRECFRLMGVREHYIDRIQNADISNSQQYKLAGNSIVVDNLFHIFRKLLIDTDTQEQEQLSLF